MPAYTVTNSRGSNVATIGVSTTTGATYPIELLGQSYSLYGGIVANNLYYLLENFAKGTPPVNPVEGMFWYDTVQTIPNFYNGARFVPVATASNSASVAFPMAVAAAAVNFAALGTTVVFTAPGSGTRYHPTMVMLLPIGTITATSPAAFNLYINTSEDILENTIIQDYAANKHASFAIQGSTRFASNVENITLEVTTAATGGDLTFTVIIFGFTT